jgi:hypothetical protein
MASAMRVLFRGFNHFGEFYIALHATFGYRLFHGQCFQALPQAFNLPPHLVSLAPQFNNNAFELTIAMAKRFDLRLPLSELHSMVIHLGSSQKTENKAR